MSRKSNRLKSRLTQAKLARDIQEDINVVLKASVKSQKERIANLEAKLKEQAALTFKFEKPGLRGQYHRSEMAVIQLEFYPREFEYQYLRYSEGRNTVGYFARGISQQIAVKLEDALVKFITSPEGAKRV